MGVAESPALMHRIARFDQDVAGTILESQHREKLPRSLRRLFEKLCITDLRHGYGLPRLHVDRHHVGVEHARNHNYMPPEQQSMPEPHFLKSRFATPSSVSQVFVSCWATVETLEIFPTTNSPYTTSFRGPIGGTRELLGDPSFSCTVLRHQ